VSLVTVALSWWFFSVQRTDHGKTASQILSTVAIPTSVQHAVTDLKRANELGNRCYDLYWNYTRDGTGSLGDARQACEAGLALVGSKPSFQKGALWFSLGLIAEQTGDELKNRGHLAAARMQWAIATSNYQQSVDSRMDSDGRSKAQKRLDALDRKCAGDCRR
jgi:hypothetical protein